MLRAGPPEERSPTVLLVLIFAVLGVVLVVGGSGHPAARDNPNIRIGLWFFGAALALIALVLFLQEL
jgi:lipopolysaccharide export LptBFGC system permease protein LptF